MDVLIISLLWLSLLYVLNLGLKTARSQQQQKAEAKQENDIFSIPERKETQGEVGMTHGLFDRFPALWDGFEKQLKGHMIEALAAKTSEEGSDSRKQSFLPFIGISDVPIGVTVPVRAFIGKRSLMKSSLNTDTMAQSNS